jgi:hypothetical protein
MLYTGTVVKHYVQMLDQFDHTVLYWNEFNLVTVAHTEKITYFNPLLCSKFDPLL